MLTQLRHAADDEILHTWRIARAALMAGVMRCEHMALEKASAAVMSGWVRSW